MNRIYLDGTFFFVLNKIGNVKATSDIGLLNVICYIPKRSIYKKDHKDHWKKPYIKNKQLSAM
ncbi:MAG: hypothetical protein GPJ54_09930 [Candidatus Heimdallarchaeota archaeon]|nr:hypothetical protein [Candidatus Heimdallarchaeota archaeon]